MSDYEDGWWYISGHRATFGIRTENDVVVETAPYAARWLKGLDADEAFWRLRKQGFLFERLKGGFDGGDAGTTDAGAA